MPGAPEEASFRRSLSRWWLAACISGFALVGWAGVPESSHDGGYYATDSPFIVGSRVFYGLMGILSLFFMVKVARMGVFADRDGLIIRNVFRTHRIDWSDIAGFERPAPYGRLRDAGLKVVLLDRPPGVRRSLQRRSVQQGDLRGRDARSARIASCDEPTGLTCPRDTCRSLGVGRLSEHARATATARDFQFGAAPALNTRHSVLVG